MEFHERRPVFKAARFTGPESVEEVLNVFGPFVGDYVLQTVKGERSICVTDKFGATHTIHDGMWAYKSPNGGTVSLISDYDFRERFEIAPKQILNIAGLGFAGSPVTKV